jgi:hypothetical protein
MNAFLKRMGGCLLVATVACMLFGPPAAQGDTLVSIGGGNPGGSFYQAAAALVAIINDKVEGYRATASTSGGSKTNSLLLGAGEIDLGMVTSNIGAEAWLGIKTFDKKIPDLRALIPGYPGANMFVTLASEKFGSLRDLEGKVVNTGTKGGANAVFARRVLEEVGVSFKEVNQSVKDAARGLVDGRIAAYVIQWPSAVVSEQEINHELRVFFASPESMGKEAFESFRNKYPGYSNIRIPAGAYKAVPKPLTALGAYNSVVATTKMGDDLAYAITNALYEHTKAVRQVFPRLSDSLRLTDAAVAYSDTENIPYHPGALRFYGEKGLKVPDHLRP